MEEVARSIRVGSTSSLAFMLAGFVAGEGSFVVTRRLPPFKDRTARLRFLFDVTVANRDRPMLEQLRSLLGLGAISDQQPAKPGWQPTSHFQIASIKAHLAATIPWADVGHVHHSPRRKAHYDDEVTFAIGSIRDHLSVTIPFMDAHLPESYKRGQYLTWRAELLDYWEHRAKRRRACTVEGCERPRRAHGYCRQHLWALLKQ